MKDIQFGPHLLAKGRAPLIVAEMSGNHNGSLERALKIVEAAAAAGAHALKLQTYTADSMTIDHDGPGFVVKTKDGLWNDRKLYDLYKEAATPYEWHKKIFDRCTELGMLGFSAPFDLEAVDFLEELKVPAYKIASFENIDLPLIKKAASTGKPLIISTGMAELAELDEAVRTAREAGCKNLILLKCTSNYPADPGESHLKTLPHLSKMFDVHVGLSDHTMGIGAALASVAMGAVVIEKHFTLDRNDGGVDSAFSSEPSELGLLVKESATAARSLGQVHYGPSRAEKEFKSYRRSLYFVRDLKRGDKISAENLRAIRPGFGLPTKYFDEVIGKSVNSDIKRGTPMSWDLIG